MEKVGRGRDPTVETPDTNTAVVSHADIMCPWSDGITRMALCVCGLPPQARKAQSVHKKNIKSIPTEGFHKMLD